MPASFLLKELLTIIKNNNYLVVGKLNFTWNIRHSFKKKLTLGERRLHKYIT